MLDTDPRDAIFFSLLGPVRAWRGGTELDLGSPQQRTTLAMLLLREGAVAGVGELVSGMWGDEPPRSAVTTIRTYVSRLRAVLGPDHPLVSAGGGYALEAGPEAVDLARFRRHAARGAEAARRGDWDTAAAEHRAALDLSLGQPLAGALGPYAQGQRTRLQQLVAAAQVDVVSAQLGLGLHREVLPEVTALAATYPLWEDVQALFMTALYGSGRAADALEHYRRARQSLIDDLGIEPGPRLRETHQRILAGDPSLTPGSPAVSTLARHKRQTRRYHQVRLAGRRPLR